MNTLEVTFFKNIQGNLATTFQSLIAIPVMEFNPYNLIPDWIQWWHVLLFCIFII